MFRTLKHTVILLGLFISSMVNAVPIGYFPGLAKLIDTADAIVILRIDRHLSDFGSPTLYSTHECYIYQTLKGDIRKNSRIKLQLMDTNTEFETPYSHGSTHLMFLMKKATENEPTDYRTISFIGAHIQLSPLGNEKMPEGETLEEKVRNLIKGAIEYENQQHEKKQAFLKSMLDIPKMQTDAIEQWNVNNDLPERVIDIRNQLLSKADHQIRTGLLTGFVEKFPQIRKARDFERIVSGKSEKGRISIWLRHTHIGKGATTENPVQEREQFSTLVMLQEPPKRAGSMAMGPIYPNLGLVGQIHAMAGDPALEVKLKILVDDALKPLAEFNESLNTEPSKQEE